MAAQGRIVHVGIRRIFGMHFPELFREEIFPVKRNLRKWKKE